jgi:hypothetical protein
MGTQHTLPEHREPKVARLDEAGSGQQQDNEP